MIFSSPLFFIFYIVVVLFCWYILPALFSGERHLFYHHLFLLIASYVFYLSWDWRFGFLISFSTVVDFVAGLLIKQNDTPEKNRIRKWILLLSVTTNLGILAYFKYTNFFISSFVDVVNGVMPGTYTSAEQESLLLDIILPLGISFFTFQSMSYTVDVYRRVIPAEKSLVKFALYVSFFPQLVAGPIVVAKDFLPQLQNLPVFDLDRMRTAARWFALGYFKKTVLADNMAPLVDAVHAAPQSFDAIGHWLGAFGFWVQVYGDFSGYTDMAWGTALFLGYNLPENFRMPYLSRLPSEHWQRWHISLIRWIRDYLYIPLGGNRVSFWRHKLNVFLTMFLAGVWHGANWTFVLWGAIHGSLLVLETIINEKLKRIPFFRDPGSSFRKIISIPFVSYLNNFLFFLGTSFCTVYFGVLFRSDDIGKAGIIMKRMIGLDSVIMPLPSISLYRPVILGCLCVIIGHIIGYRIFEKKREWNIPVWAEFAIVPLLILLFIQLGTGDASPFIYFVF